MKDNNFKLITQFFSVLLLVSILIWPLGQLSAQTGGFDPSLLITDSRFSNSDAFASSDAVQRFLEQKNSSLANISPEFLKQLKEPADVDLKIRLEDPNPNLGRLRTAAELIYDSAKLSEINPQVILATLQKEQSLISANTTNLQRRLDRAIGYACPDGGSCDDLLLSFYAQLFGNLDNENNRYLGGVRSLSKSFYTEGGRGPAIDSAGRTFGSEAKVRTSKVGDIITLNNTQGPPNNAPATQIVTLSNSATAALYRYTPHVYNGNYNFWKFFNEWFRFTNGSLVRLPGSEIIYFIDNGTRRAVSGTVLTQRQLDVTQAFTVSETEISDFPLSAPLPPKDGTLVSPASGEILYVVEDNELHELSDFVVELRNLNNATTVFLPNSEVSGYAKGSRALPPQGTLLRGVTNPEVYVVEGNTIRPISGFVFGQRGFNFRDVVVGPDSEVSLLPKGQILSPLDGTLVKNADSPLIYYVALGQRFPVPYFVFQSRKLRFADVVTLSDDEIENLILAENHFAPADGTLIKHKGDPTVYFVEAGELHAVTGFLFGHLGFRFSNVIEVTQDELNLIPVNSPLHLPDQSLIKIEGDSTVYIIEDGVKHTMNLEAFNSRGLSFGDVIEVPEVEADRYPSGSGYFK